MKIKMEVEVPDDWYEKQFSSRKKQKNIIRLLDGRKHSVSDASVRKSIEERIRQILWGAIREIEGEG